VWVLGGVVGGGGGGGGGGGWGGGGGGELLSVSRVAKFRHFIFCPISEL
jgi:hypothetical protein